MTNTTNKSNPYIGLEPLKGHFIKKEIGAGKIGTVYTVERSDFQETLACKVIPEGGLRDGWERELEKAIELSGIPNVVQYRGHGTGFDKNNRPYYWILWNFIDGNNLKQYLEENPSLLDMAFIEYLAKTILSVLHACRSIGHQHGDLHEGNILVSKPDSRLPGNKRMVWITDFGYGGSHNRLKPRDDYKQFFSIISNLLRRLKPADLNPRDKVLHQKVRNFLEKKLLEVDPTQGNYVGNSEMLLNDFEKLSKNAEIELALATKGEEHKSPGDYLFAEALGYMVEEWKELFVPEFLAAQDLLSRNITVLTGARGCGKTMSFRRLTAYMDKVIGKPSGVKGADQFIGFYINCRDLIEAIPWLPTEINNCGEQQIIHCFHLDWFSEICKTLAVCTDDRHDNFDWLDEFVSNSFGERYQSLPKGADVLSHVRAFIETEKERCRLADFGKTNGLKEWPLARIDFLDIFQAQLESFVPWIEQKILYLFLDDYTMPTIPRVLQQILNPIIFKRRSKIFFKVSTESANSFERKGLRGKPLELHQDFELIDLATESIHQTGKDKKEFLENIFKPRIDRHPSLKGKNLTLSDVLRNDSITNNELAYNIRNAAAKKKASKRIYYHGIKVFVGMWTSDIRIMIQVFTDILREATNDLQKSVFEISKTIQNKCYKSAGGEFLNFTESVVDPYLMEEGMRSTKQDKSFGRHLKEIVEAFVKVSRYEMIEGKLVGNQGRLNPKQAFRIEIVDMFDLSEEANRFYEGLVRWHIFLQDWRGKSIRGMITPRLYLNRVLIPFSGLTFSIHDNIHFNNAEFEDLLLNPKGFIEYWQKKRKEEDLGQSHFKNLA